MSSSSDYLLDSVISEALELPSSLRQEYVRKALQAQPSLISVAMDLLNGMENMPNSFLDKLPVVPDAGSLFEGFQESTDTALKPGDKFKSFEILKLLDEGGMGKVYLAEQKTERIKRKVAIKVVHGDLATTEVLKRFKHEQKILSELQHANIATLFDADVTEQGTPYLVMEYIEGKHIDVHCDAKSLSIKERLKLFKTVCDAVQYAQDNLIVHRDLKPSNILITKKGRDVKLLDFGIAKLKDTAQEILKSEHKGPTVNGAATKGAATNSFTPNGSVANGFDKNDQLNGAAKHTNITNINAPYTPAYAAPEQFAGEPVNAATDVYSLGVILFKLLTGLLPQKGEEQTAEEDQESTSGKTTTNQLKPSRQLTRYKTEEDKTKKEEASRVRGNKNLTHLKRELSGDLDAIVIKALEEKGKDRYASAGELGRDIQRYLDRRPIQARPQTLRYRSAKFVRRYHRTAIAALIGFLVLIGGIFTTVREANKKEQATQAQTATIGFISNILDKVDPDQKEGYSFTTKELIVAGLSELQHLETQPLVHAGIMNEFGKIALNTGLIGLADSLHNKALTIQKDVLSPFDSELAETYTRIAEVYERKGNSESALEYFFKALSIKPDYHQARNNLALLYLNQGRYQEAAEEFNLAYELAPTEVKYLRNSGAIYFAISEWTKAKNVYIKAIELEPHYNAYSNLATILYYIDQDYPKAAQYYQNALDINENDYSMWGNLASALFASDSLSKDAIQATNRAIELAEEHLEKLNADDAEVHASLAGYYARINRLDKSRLYIEKSLTASEPTTDIIYNIGYAYEIIGEREKALEYIERAIAEDFLPIYILNEPELGSLCESTYFKEVIVPKYQLLTSP